MDPFDARSRPPRTKESKSQSSAVPFREVRPTNDAYRDLWPSRDPLQEIRSRDKGEPAGLLDSRAPTQIQPRLPLVHKAFIPHHPSLLNGLSRVSAFTRHGFPLYFISCSSSAPGWYPNSSASLEIPHPSLSVRIESFPSPTRPENGVASKPRQRLGRW